MLHQLGIAAMEADTLITLLSEPEGMSVVRLGRKLNLPRTTIYGHLGSLAEKGLVKKGMTEKGSLFYAEDIETIANLFNDKKRDIEAAKQEFEKILSSEFIAPSYNPKFTVYDRPGAAAAIFHDILRSRPQKTCWFWPVGEMIKTVPEEVFAFFQAERAKRMIYLDVLWPKRSAVDLKKHPYLTPERESLRNIKILPGEIDSMMGYGIYGNKVAFISSKRENYGFIIDSKELSETFQSQFDYFWKISKGYKENKIP
ncbi:MAG: helix-turn-helix domain-containing protein [Patescibacteria group bacterium]